MLLKDKLNVMVDIDGTVSDDIPNEESHRFISASLIENSVENVNKLYDAGHFITFFTSRNEKDRKDTEKWLNEHNFKYHQLLMNKPRGGNYVWIDNLHVKGVHFQNNWDEVFNNVNNIKF